nr:hypothetical protein [Tanacetum cinerariifolium]
MIFVNNSKTNSKNDDEKVYMHWFPPPEPKVSYFDDLDFFNDFRIEFSAIVYNDAPTSKSDLFTEPTVSPQHINEIDLNDEQNVIYFNDLFPFNAIHHDDSNSDKDNDDDEIDIIQSLGEVAKAKVRFLYFAKFRENWSPKNGYDVLDMDFLPRDQRHQYLRDSILRLCHRLIACSIAGRSQAPEKVIVTDLFYLRGMDVDSINIPYLLARYLRRFSSGRKQGTTISAG